MPKFYSDVYVNSPVVTISSVTGNKPLLTLTTTDDSLVNNSSEIKFFKDSASEAGEDLGLITWRGLDSVGTQTKYCEMRGEIVVNTDSDELGQLSLTVRNEGSYLSGLVVKGTATTGEVDVDIANGPASTTTIAGDLSITTGLLLDGADITTIQTNSEIFADNNSSLMTSGAIADYVAANGGGAVTVADESSDTTCFPLFATAATGPLLPKSGSNLTFNSSTGILTSTDLVATAQVTAKRYNITLSGGAAGTNGGAEIVYWGTNTITTAGKIYYYNGSGAWSIANATAVATCKGLLAVAAGTSSATNGMILNGCVTLNHDPGNIGDVLYLDTAAPGQAINTISSTQNHVVRVIGYQIEHVSGGKIYFNPDNTFVEIA